MQVFKPIDSMYLCFFCLGKKMTKRERERERRWLLKVYLFTMKNKNLYNTKHWCFKKTIRQREREWESHLKLKLENLLLTNIDIVQHSKYEVMIS